MPIDVYYSPASAPCRAVFMLVEALNIQVNPIILKLADGEQLKPEFLKINPQHCIPTIVDDGFALWESRAILTYLVNKYAKGSSWYPEDPQQRAIIDQRLYFDIEKLYPSYAEYFYPPVFSKQPADEAKLKKLEEALELLNTFLEGRPWVAGPNPTVADISIVTKVSNIADVANVNIDKFSNVKAWYERARNTLPGCRKTETFPENLKKLIEELKKTNASSFF